MVYVQTPQQFGIVSLASPQLEKEINELVKLLQNFKMSPSLRFLSKRVGCIVAPQPWCTADEI
jgi:hypothetical protein